MQIHTSFPLQPPVSQPGSHEFTVLFSPRLSEAGVGRQAPSGLVPGGGFQTHRLRWTGPSSWMQAPTDGPVWILECKHGLTCAEMH